MNNYMHLLVEGHSAYWELLNTVLGAFTHDNSLTPHSLQPTNCIWERREAGSVRLPLPDSGRTRDSSMSYELLTLRLLLLCCLSRSSGPELTLSGTSWTLPAKLAQVTLRPLHSAHTSLVAITNPACPVCVLVQPSKWGLLEERMLFMLDVIDT